MFFTVDVTACRHCGLCTSGCVCGLLTPGPNGVPYVEPGRESLCVHCGHCAAVCPEGAITLDGIAPDKLEAADPPVPVFMAQHLLKTRRAIRNFQPSAIDNALLDEVLSLATYAPTAHNARQVSYIVINGRDKVEKLLHATVRLMEEHHFYPNHTKNVAMAMIRCFAGLPASFSFMLLSGFFPKRIALRQPVTWN